MPPTQEVVTSWTASRSRWTTWPNSRTAMRTHCSSSRVGQRETAEECRRRSSIGHRPFGQASPRLRHLAHIPVVDLLAGPVHDVVAVDIGVELLEIFDAVRGAAHIRVHADRQDAGRLARLPIEAME